MPIYATFVLIGFGPRQPTPVLWLSCIDCVVFFGDGHTGHGGQD